MSVTMPGPVLINYYIGVIEEYSVKKKKWLRIYETSPGIRDDWVAMK